MWFLSLCAPVALSINAVVYIPFRGALLVASCTCTTRVLYAKQCQYESKPRMRKPKDPTGSKRAADAVVTYTHAAPDAAIRTVLCHEDQDDSGMTEEQMATNEFRGARRRPQLDVNLSARVQSSWSPSRATWSEERLLRTAAGCEELFRRGRRWCSAARSHRPRRPRRRPRSGHRDPSTPATTISSLRRFQNRTSALVASTPTTNVWFCPRRHGGTDSHNRLGGERALNCKQCRSVARLSQHMREGVAPPAAATRGVQYRPHDRHRVMKVDVEARLVEVVAGSRCSAIDTPCRPPARVCSSSIRDATTASMTNSQRTGRASSWA